MTAVLPSRRPEPPSTAAVQPKASTQQVAMLEGPNVGRKGVFIVVREAFTSWDNTLQERKLAQK